MEGPVDYTSMLLDPKDAPGGRAGGSMGAPIPIHPTANRAHSSPDDGGGDGGEPLWTLRTTATHADMDMKWLSFVAVVLVVALYAPQSEAKPISLVERCYCRSAVSSLPRGVARELRFIRTPNCPFQVIAKLKSNKEVCVNPDMPWLQQYLKNAIRRMKKNKKSF
ncbi:hypothetical protein CRUP_004207 [Coryphaenoides rupestris]|nr:hypothetical protein CRUP_004207 [Coryphaenoides rupestris]